MTRRVALMGNPNVGKSTIFNGLTRLRQHTGNWAGVTVSCALTVTGAPAVESTGVTAGDGFAISENSETSLVVAAA